MDFSKLIYTLEDAWKAIRANHPEMPECVVIVGSGGRRATTLLGHFARNTWELDGQQIHEILIVAEQLKREPKEIFQTLLHESVHSLAEARKIKDVSGRRHNRKFAVLCSEVGLIPPEDADPILGFSHARLSEATEGLYAVFIERIAEQLTMYRKLKLTEKKANKTTWVALCGCDRKIRVGKKTIIDPEFLNIGCKTCGTDFELEDYDEN